MARKSNWEIENQYTDKKGRTWYQERNKELGRRRVTSVSPYSNKKELHRTWTPNANRKADVDHYFDSIKQLF